MFLPDCHQPGSHVYLPRSWPLRWSLKIQRWLWRWHPRTLGGRGWCPDWLEGAAWKVKLTLTWALRPLGKNMQLEGSISEGRYCKWGDQCLGTCLLWFGRKEGPPWHRGSFQVESSFSTLVESPVCRLSTWMGSQQTSDAALFRKGGTPYLMASHMAGVRKTQNRKKRGSARCLDVTRHSNQRRRWRGCWTRATSEENYCPSNRRHSLLSVPVISCKGSASAQDPRGAVLRWEWSRFYSLCLTWEAWETGGAESVTPGAPQWGT